MQSEFLRLLAIATDLIHLLAMVVWGLGMPLLIWHRFPRLSRAYMRFAIGFVFVSVASHWALGECLLTTLARSLWEASGESRDRVPFTVLLVDAVAGMRPRERIVVWLWEATVFIASCASLWCWYKTRPEKMVPEAVPSDAARRSGDQGRGARPRANEC